MQLQDETLRRINEILRRKPTTNEERQVHTDYKLENSRICRKTDNTEKWVVPKEVIWRVIQASHDDMGHYGVDKTLCHVRRYFWFPKMRKKIKNYISACVRCAYHKIERGKPEGEMHIIERVPIPFHTVNLDHLGPFVNSTQRHNYVLLYQDNFTKYSIIRAVKTTKSKPVISILKEIFSYFGTPVRLITDRGTAFTSKEFEKFCADNQVIHIKNATSTPRANGQRVRIKRY